MKYSEMTQEQVKHRKGYHRQYHVLWYQKNKERLKPIRKAYAQTHKGDSVKRVQRYVKKHKARVQKYNSEYNRKLAGKWRSIKSSSKARNLLLTLTEGEFEKLLSSLCHYCGNTNDIGIDRVDNSLGYTLENSVSCCSKCNYMKKTLNVENFLLHIAKIYNYNKN